jgi:hypothetical protein
MAEQADPERRVGMGRLRHEVEPLLLAAQGPPWPGLASPPESPRHPELEQVGGVEGVRAGTQEFLPARQAVGEPLGDLDRRWLRSGAGSASVRRPQATANSRTSRSLACARNTSSIGSGSEQASHSSPPGIDRRSRLAVLDTDTPSQAPRRRSLPPRPAHHPTRSNPHGSRCIPAPRRRAGTGTRSPTASRTPPSGGHRSWAAHRSGVS